MRRFARRWSLGNRRKSEMERISKFARPLGVALAVVGVSMVAISGYYLYAYMRSGTDADSFNVVAVAPEGMPALLGQVLPQPSPNESVADQAMGAGVENGIADAGVAHAARPIEVSGGADTVSIASILPGVGLVSDGDKTSPAAIISEAGPPEPISKDHPFTARSKNVEVGVADFDDPSVSASLPTDVMLNTFGAIYPGGNMNPRYWSEPHWAGNLPFGGPTIPDGFEPVDPSDLVHAATSGERALRMRIPSIDLDASVSELEIRDLGDSREWSTPDKVVGHIPTTAKPGESANGWYFGHLDNFLSNEGDIFRRLPEISSMIQNDPVDIFLTTADAEYMYRVTNTQQVHRDELYLAQSDNAQISLVTCWPFRVYDHRIVVSAVLIAVKPLNEA